MDASWIPQMLLGWLIVIGYIPLICAGPFVTYRLFTRGRTGAAGAVLAVHGLALVLWLWYLIQDARAIGGSNETAPFMTALLILFTLLLYLGAFAVAMVMIFRYRS